MALVLFKPNLHLSFRFFNYVVKIKASQDIIHSLVHLLRISKIVKHWIVKKNKCQLLLMFDLLIFCKKNTLHDIHLMFSFCACGLIFFRFYNNAHYAKVGGITKVEMNFLELDFLFGLGFHLNVTPGTFQAYCVHLQREMLLIQPLNFSDSTLNLGQSLKAHLCFNEDECSHQKQKQQQQLAVWFLAFSQCMCSMVD